MRKEEYKELHKLYPTLTDEELEIASENLDRYAKLAWEIIQEAAAKEDGGTLDL